MKSKSNNNEELILALDQLEAEKNISKEVLLETIENSLLAACKNEFDRIDNIRVNIDREKGSITVYAAREVVEEVEDPAIQISVTEAKEKFPSSELGDIVNIVVTPKNFGRIAAQKAKQVVVQKIREEERNVQFEHYYSKEKDIVTGIVQRNIGKNISINLGKVDALLTESEQVKTERFKKNDRIKLYIIEVKSTTKGPKIVVSRSHPELVKRLFEAEVAEVRDGTVEIKSIAREPGSRTKMAVYSNVAEVDPVGACVGVNGSRVNTIVEELRGEKIDIINWSEDPASLIENALSPAKVVSVFVSDDERDRSAKVVVPDYQLSLAIGKEGQNARLAARLTGYRIDIKNETQYREEQLEQLEEDLDNIDFEDDEDYDEFNNSEYDEEFDNSEFYTEESDYDQEFDEEFDYSEYDFDDDYDEDYDLDEFYDDEEYDESEEYYDSEE